MFGSSFKLHSEWFFHVGSTLIKSDYSDLLSDILTDMVTLLNTDIAVNPARLQCPKYVIGCVICSHVFS